MDTTQSDEAGILKRLVLKSIPGSQVSVRTYQGSDHFEMVVISEKFSGKNLVAQHQMVYQALGDKFRENVHALTLKTCTPEDEK